METIHLAEIAEIGTRTLTSSAEAIAAVAEPIADELVDLVLNRRHEDHGDGSAGGFEASEHLEAVDAGQPHVEEHECRRGPLDEGEGFLSAARLDDGDCFVLEVGAHELA